MFISVDGSSEFDPSQMQRLLLRQQKVSSKFFGDLSTFAEEVFAVDRKVVGEQKQGMQ
jgi:hypothetical protein